MKITLGTDELAAAIGDWLRERGLRTKSVQALDHDGKPVLVEVEVLTPDAAPKFVRASPAA